MKLTLIALCFFLITSCIQNPEAEIQNQKIKDLLEKNDYLNMKVNEQFNRISDLNAEIKDVKSRLGELEKVSSKKIVYRNRKFLPDSLNVNIRLEKGN
jgi:peptidoglycan hydrolase CwlO-like protein